MAALSPDRYRLQLTIGGETLEKLRLAKDMIAFAGAGANLFRKKFGRTKHRRTRHRDEWSRSARGVELAGRIAHGGSGSLTGSRRETEGRSQCLAAK